MCALLKDPKQFLIDFCELYSAAKSKANGRDQLRAVFEYYPSPPTHKKIPKTKSKTTKASDEAIIKLLEKVLSP
jgi:hypothetical protein